MSALVQTIAAMGTTVTCEVPEAGRDRAAFAATSAAVRRALDWFRTVENACTRFDPRSELRRLCAVVGRPVRVGTLLFEPLQFALKVAEESDGAFDPTMGALAVARGFDREFRTGRRLAASPPTRGASYRDVILDAAQRTVMLTRPLQLDLGAVAKGLALDLAAHELRQHYSFALDAGGDVCVAGHNGAGKLWRVGIRHPRDPRRLIACRELTDGALCTSGDYERRTTAADEHHIVDPALGRSPRGVLSASVMAPSAMVADALSTAAFVLGPRRGCQLLERHGVEGMIVSAELAWPVMID